MRRRVMMQAIRDGDHPLGAPRARSPAVTADAPDVAVGAGGFVVAWHEEQFPATRTIVQPVALEEGR